MNYVVFNTSRMTYLYFDASHKKCETYDITKADTFDEVKARNIIANSIAPSEQYKWDVVQGINKFSVSTCDIQPIESNIENSTVMHELCTIMQAADKLQGYINQLAEKQREYEKQQQDVLHYIEKYDLNACDGFKAYKLLKEIRMERRKVKNEIKKAQMLDLSGVCGIDFGSLLRQMAVLDTHTDYNPRVLSELFAQKEPSRNEITVTSEKCG